jgi:formylglycine-generating enzyme required for sulfatase activity
VDGENYLIPVDFELKGESDVRYDAHPAGRVQDLMERSGAKLNIVVLDACRDNPFHSGNRASGGGLAAMTGGKGTFIAFATSPGKTASDNPGGKNGLFTQYLLEALPQPGLGLGEVFDVVRERVDATSKGKQLPWTLSSVVGRYSFVPGTGTLVGNAPTGRPSPTPSVNTPDPRAGAKPPLGPNPPTTKVNEKDGLTYVWIPPGTFMMGCSPGDTECDDNERPAHQVTITQGFWMGQTPVTVGAWKKVYGQGLPNGYYDGYNPAWKDAQKPIVGADWGNNARKYCGDVGMRLPTEAEWEYAARGGTTGARYGNLGDVAWYGDNSGTQRMDSTAILNSDRDNYWKRLRENGNGPKEVGQKRGNAFGLYDMLGNVWQWVEDKWGYYQGSNAKATIGLDGVPWPTGAFVLRGGSWGSTPSPCECRRVVRLKRAAVGIFLDYGVSGNNCCDHLPCREGFGFAAVKLLRGLL